MKIYLCTNCELLQENKCSIEHQDICEDYEEAEE